jgi:hypothetical protein
MQAGLNGLLRAHVSGLPEEKLCEVRLEWAKRHNLTADQWCLTWLRDTLEHNRLYGAKTQVVLVFNFAGPPSVEPPPLPNLVWNPFELPREEMERRYREYLNRVEDNYLRAGYATSPERREPAHRWWLAGYQVCGWTKNRIALAVGHDPAAVNRAVKNMAGAIGLTPRSSNVSDRGWTVDKIRSALDLASHR